MMRANAKHPNSLDIPMVLGQTLINGNQPPKTSDRGTVEVEAKTVSKENPDSDRDRHVTDAHVSTRPEDTFDSRGLPEPLIRKLGKLTDNQDLFPQEKKQTTVHRR